jgi:Skp family chaperone for outer membrane proteins
MSTIKEIRGAIDAKLDKWEAQATALQAQLELNKEDIIERVEEQKRRFEQVAQHIRDKIGEASGLAEDVKAKIITAFEHLQVQLALGAADTRDAYQDWKQKLETSIATFEAELDVAMAKEDAALEADLDALMDAYVREADALEAEIDAMQAQFDEDKARAKADFEKYKQDVQSRIDAYKNELDERRKTASGKLDTFEAELSAGATKIKDAFNNLFS